MRGDNIKILILNDGCQLSSLENKQSNVQKGFDFFNHLVMLKYAAHIASKNFTVDFFFKLVTL